MEKVGFVATAQKDGERRARCSTFPQWKIT